MNRLILFIVFVFCLLVSVSTSFAENLHCSSSSAGNNDGSDWANCWDCDSVFASGGALWGAGANKISANDTLYIDGGVAGVTYTWVRGRIQGSGTSGNVISIKPGAAHPTASANHDGTVTITPSTYEAFWMNDKEYITISGNDGSGNRKMRITGCQGDGIVVEGTSDYIVLEYMEIDNNGDAPSESGIRCPIDSGHNFSSFELAYCYIHDNYQDGITITSGTVGSSYGSILIHHNTMTNTHDDVIECWNSSVDIYNNVLGDRILAERGHPDVLQLYATHYRIWNNEIRGWRDVTGNQHNIIYWTPQPSHTNNQPTGFIVYNNWFHEDVMSATNCHCITIALTDSAFTAASEIYVLNNTFKGHDSTFLISYSGSTSLGGSDHTNCYVENNIFYDSTGYEFPASEESGNAITYGSHADGDSWSFDYNVFNSSNNVIYLGNNETYASFKSSSGCQDSEVITDPSVQSDGTITAGSSAINVGVDWSSLFTTDRAGTTRPEGVSWDIGSHEYIATGEATGTIVFGGCPEGDIRSGGRTIVVELAGDTWDATLGADNAVTTAFIQGFDSAQSEANGWNNEVRDVITYTAVARTDADTATVTLPALASYNITADETITMTIDASCVAGSSNITATPSFIISVEQVGVETFGCSYKAGAPTMSYDSTGPSIVAP